ncbi:MAG: hypothetical protein NVS3B14_11820 [Ktedonobacteraceae bacterium]
MMLKPFFLCMLAAFALGVGAIAGFFGAYAWVAIIGALIMTFILVLRQDELAVTILIAIHLYVDWYLTLHLIGITLILLLLVIFFLTRTHPYKWANPRHFWLWLLFLALAILPAMRGALTLYDTATFYPSNVLGAFLVFWLGTIIAQDYTRVRRFLSIFAVLGVLLAIHTAIQATTAKVLFESTRSEVFLSTVTYEIGGQAHRAGSFFVDPNWNGTLFAIMIFLPLGLLIESTSLLAKILCLCAIFLLAFALLSTYSSGAWIGVSGGMAAFVIMIGRMRYRLFLLLFILLVAILLIVLFQTQLTIQLQHASDAQDLALRVAAWQTALRVIQAFPLTGVGLGYQAYLLRADPYRVPAQYEPLEHPHNAYLEWGAMAGLPVLLLFLALLLSGLWSAWRNWKLLRADSRPLLGGGIAAIVALSVNSWTINGWTQPVLGMIGWLILGVVSSPLLERSLKDEPMQRKTATETEEGQEFYDYATL